MFWLICQDTYTCHILLRLPIQFHYLSQSNNLFNLILHKLDEPGNDDQKLCFAKCYEAAWTELNLTQCILIEHRLYLTNWIKHFVPCNRKCSQSKYREAIVYYFGCVTPNLPITCGAHKWFCWPLQSSQNVPAAGHLATYSEISFSYFTLVRLVYRMRLPLLPITIASFPSTQKHFDWAALHFLWHGIK